MKFFNIEEPIAQPTTPNIHIDSIGIDFGTTNSLVAAIVNGKPMIIGTRGMVESLVSIEDEHDFAVGHKSASHIKSIKRIMGKSAKEIKASDILSDSIKKHIILENDQVQIKVNNQLVSPRYIASKIFLHLKNQAEEHFDAKINQVVVTVPAHFDEVARGEIKMAAELAGLKVLRLISEPTAAAYAYGLESKAQGNYLVYDFGGGTFDVSLLRMHMGAFQVLATDGNSMLGGDDIDYALANYIKDLYLKEADLGVTEDINFIELAIDVKKKLTTKPEVILNINSFEILITQERFNSIALPFVNETIAIVKRVLESNQNKGELRGIIMVGGSTRLLLVQKLLLQNFPDIPLLCDVDPDKVVAFGAAFQAHNLTNKIGDILIDVTPLSLGIEVMGGFVEKIIERNTPIPTSITKHFTTYADNQSGINFHVVQGEREFATHCRSLAYFELKNLPPAFAGQLDIEVTFQIDADGLLNVRATEATTGQLCDVSVKPIYDLAEEQIDEMLYDAFKNAKSDHLMKLLNDARLKTKLLHDNLTKMFNNSADIFISEETKKAQDLMVILYDLIQSEDLQSIEHHLELLEQEATVLTEKFLNYKLVQALQGKNINDLS
jgi:molecular chaperone HscA